MILKYIQFAGILKTKPVTMDCNVHDLHCFAINCSLKRQKCVAFAERGRSKFYNSLEVMLYCISLGSMVSESLAVTVNTSVF